MPLAWGMAAMATASVSADNPFVCINTLSSDIIEDIRYSGSNNFVGKPMPGYSYQSCMLRADAAKGLKNAQALLSALRPEFRLKVFDCYRPKKAVAAFVEWANSSDLSSHAQYHYPNTPRVKLLELGYIAKSSMHSTGLAVDLTIVGQRSAAATNTSAKSVDCTSPIPFADGSLDMGTDFDCFDTKSWTSSRRITESQRASRALLVEVMNAAGFRNYSREWWHFTYIATPSAALDHDIEVCDPVKKRKMPR